MPKYIREKAKLAEKIRLLREEAELTQQEVADKLRKERSTYTYYEIGKTEPSFFVLLELSDIFGVSFETLISDDMD